VPLLTNGFEGGTNGATITAANSGGGSANKFTAVSCTGGSATYSTAAAHGLLGVTLASSSPCYLQWSGASVPSTSNSYGRLYLNRSANPGATQVLVKMGDASFVRDAQINIGTNGRLQLIDSANVKQVTFTNAIPLNSWVRIEWHLVNAATGSLQVSMYLGDSLTPIETETASGINTGTVLGSLQVGSVIAGAVGSTSLDDLAYGTTGPLGPAS
jgi:hypothetical protein